MFASDFSDLCAQTIVWEAMTGRDAYGKPTYAAPQVFAPPNGGRRVYKSKRVAGFSRAVKGEGAEVVSQSEIVILGVPTFGLGSGYEDRAYVSGDTVFPPIVLIESYPDETGITQYVKVSLGNADG